MGSWSNPMYGTSMERGKHLLDTGQAIKPIKAIEAKLH